MAIDKLTLFELHFDGAQFGPREMTAGDERTADDGDATARDAAGEESSGGAGRVLSLAVASVVVSVVATVLARRLFGDDGEQTTVDEFAGESVDVTDGGPNA